MKKKTIVNSPDDCAPETEGQPIGISDLIAAAPDLILSAMFLAVWIDPMVLGAGMAEDLVMLMILEFIVIHSSVLLGATLLDPSNPKRGKMLLFLCGVYLLFALAISASVKSHWPLTYLVGLTVNRFLGLLLGQAPTGKEKDMMMGLWAASAVYYLLGAFGTILIPLPELGLGRHAPHLPGEGLWVDEPHRAIAFGFIYFAANGMTAMKAGGIKWGDASNQAARRR
jgi:hypothetical protein